MASFKERVETRGGKERKYVRVRFTDILGNKKEFNAPNKLQAKKKMDSWNDKLRSDGMVIDDSKAYTVAEWTLKHLLIYKYGKVSAGTFEGYMAIYKNQIEYSQLGMMKLTKVKPIDVQNFLNQFSTLSYSTLKKYYLVLLQSFDSAVNNELMVRNPARGVIIPNKDIDPKDITVLTREQQRKYIRALQGELHENLYLTLLFTGMRLGEALALKWSDIDFKAHTITINTSVRRVRTYNTDGTPSESKTITTPPKRKSIRTIPLPTFIHDRLSPLRPKDLNTYVFPTTTGNIQTARNVRKYHDRICENAGLPKFGLHTLRHTYVTRLLEVGENPKTIQVLVGHKDIQTTLNIYAHVLEDSKKESATIQDLLYKELM